MTIHRIKLKDLNEAFIQQLRDELADENAELTIWLPEKIDRNILSEEDFWKVIALLNWDAKNNEAVTQPVIQYLSQQPIPVINTFEDILSEKLFLLDGQKYAEHSGENAYQGEDEPFSVDEFLYARCYVVSQGEGFYNSVQKEPSSMPKNLSFEPLLSLAALAFERKTGQQFQHIPAYIIETFANSNGWENQSLITKILS